MADEIDSYLLELVQLTYCTANFDLHTQRSRELPELITLALIENNLEFQLVLAQVSRLLDDLGIEDTLDLEVYNSDDFVDLRLMVHDMNPQFFSYHDIKKLLRDHFGITVDKARIRNSLKHLVSWDWVYPNTSGTGYCINPIHVTRSIVLKRLRYDQQVLDEIDALSEPDVE